MTPKKGVTTIAIRYTIPSVTPKNQEWGRHLHQNASLLAKYFGGASVQEVAILTLARALADALSFKLTLTLTLTHTLTLTLTLSLSLSLSLSLTHTHTHTRLPSRVPQCTALSRLSLFPLSLSRHLALSSSSPSVRPPSLSLPLRCTLNRCTISRSTPDLLDAEDKVALIFFRDSWECHRRPLRSLTDNYTSVNENHSTIKLLVLIDCLKSMITVTRQE